VPRSTLCGAGYGERGWERVNLPQRLPGVHLGHGWGHDRPGLLESVVPRVRPLHHPVPTAATRGAAGRWTGQAARSAHWRRLCRGGERYPLVNSASVALSDHRSRRLRAGQSSVIGGEGQLEGSFDALLIVVGHRSSQLKPPTLPYRPEAGGA
jgi:hypothetical protein